MIRRHINSKHFNPFTAKLFSSALLLCALLVSGYSIAQVANDAPLDPAVGDRISDWENTLYEESQTAIAGVDQLIAMVNESVINSNQKLKELGSGANAGSAAAKAAESGAVLFRRADGLIAYLQDFRLDRHDPAVPVSIGPWLDSCLVYRQLHRDLLAKPGTPSRGLRNPAMPYLGTLSENVAKHTLDLHRNILILQVMQAELEGLNILVKRAATGGTANFIAANTALNVIYVGVDNPILVSAEGVATSSINATGMGARPGPEAGSFILKPTAPGFDSIAINAQDLAGNAVKGSVGFRVLPIPAPNLYIGESSGGVLRKPTLQAADEIVVRNSSFPLAYNFDVKSIELVYTPEYGSTRTLTAKGSRLSFEMKDVMRKQIRANQVLLVRAKVLMPDGSTKTISSTFRIQ